MEYAILSSCASKNAIFKAGICHCHNALCQLRFGFTVIWPVLGDKIKADGIQHIRYGVVPNFVSEHYKAETFRKNMHTYYQWDVPGRTPSPHHKISLMDFFTCYRKYT